MPEHTLIIVTTAVFCLIYLERFFPAHTSAHHGRNAWYLRGSAITFLNIFVFVCVDRFVSKLATPVHLIPIVDSLPSFWGALIGYVIFTFIVYWWHRARHHYAPLWRWFHQLHHSPTRIEMLTAYYIHPLDLIANLLISNVIVFLILGLNIEGASYYTIITGVAGFIIHANIKLPRWIGYVFQTPEMHRVHHKQGHHKHNYSDLVIWDYIFGTYLNPIIPVTQCGFDNSSEKYWGQMLCGRSLPNSPNSMTRNSETKTTK